MNEQKRERTWATELRNDPRLPSAAALIAANLLPVFGVLVWGWSAFSLLWVYWAEIVIVGAFSLLRLAFARPSIWWLWILKIALSPVVVFLLLPVLMSVGGIAWVIASQAGNDELKAAAAAAIGPYGLDEPNPVETALQTFVATGDGGMRIAVLALAVSHCIAFVWNYLLRGDCHRADLFDLVAVPILRIWLILGIALLAFVIADWFHAPVAVLVLLIGVKTALDLLAHLKEHKPAVQVPI